MRIKFIKLQLFIAFSILLIGSCSEDFLDQKPPSVLTELSYYKNVPELETALVACFGYLEFGFEIDHWGMGDIGSDDAEKGSTDGDQVHLNDICFSRQQAQNQWVFYYWMDMYAIIARCNQVIDKSKDTQGDPVKIEIIVDQARFLRAFCYYHLVTLFGDIPLVDKFLDPSERNLSRSPSSDIWALIESDLKEATDLPTKSGWNQSGRVTSGAVYSLLGKVCLTQKKYSEANRAFYKVVSSNEYQLVPDFGLIFRHEGENCAESVFEIQIKSEITSGNGYFQSAVYRIPRDPEAGGWGFDCPTANLLAEFEPGDPRIIYTFIFKGDKFRKNDGSIYTVKNTLSPTGYNARKAWIPLSERAGKTYSGWDINCRYMRYSEILLLYAESLNEINKPDSALLLLNKVRTRARNAPKTDPQRISCAYTLPNPVPLLPDITITNQAELRKAIWHEQRVELAIEGHRRYMLLRLGQFKERMEAVKGPKGCTVEPHELLLPIPLWDIDRSEGRLIQNPGY